ncbi:MAG: SDR family oxidoreductase [Actinomycetota bacterium]|nr:SDR family oxidoreductase [Actinomycetota bacterium]
MKSPKTCVVTGANSGIGRSTALLLAKSGYRVFATMRSLDRGQKLRDAAQSANLEISEVELDVTDDASVTEGFARVFEETPNIDVLVNNAGIGSNAAIEDIVLPDDKMVFETNFWGMVRCTQAALPSMRAQGSGHIVQISSIAGRVGLPGQPIYSASKWAMEGLTENLAHDLAPFGIRVSLIEPGVTRTAILGKNSEAPNNPVYANTYLRMMDMYAAGIEANIRPEVVSETILECLNAPPGQLRWPVAWGASGMINARNDGTVSDKEWADLGQLVDSQDDWIQRFKELFNL